MTKNKTNTQTYESYISNLGLSANTIKNYIHDLKMYFEYFNLNSDTNPILTRESILTYKSHLLSNSKSALTINRILSSLKSYNNYLIEIGNMDSLIIVKNYYIKVQTPEESPNDLSDAEISKFIIKIKQKESKRNYTIIMFLLSTGLRISEALDLKLTDIDLNDLSLLVRDSKGKQRDADFPENITSILREYINIYRPECKYAAQSPYLFVSQKSIKIHPSTIEKRFNPYSNKITPHKLRHYYASYMAENNILNARQLQDQLGHSNINTTQKYWHPKRELVKKQINKLNMMAI